MTKEELIKKWLDHELNAEESKAFEALEDASELIKLSDHLQQFKAPEFNTSEALSDVLGEIKSKSSRPGMRWTRFIVRVAAVIAISFSVYYYASNLDTNVTTRIAQKTMLELPDDSEVVLNAVSTLSFNKKDWRNVRNVFLEGEAYFKVEKGQKFSVITPVGNVTVLGTQFNVKQRDDLFEVICYEGSVQVTYQSEIQILKPGDHFLILAGKYIAKEKETSLNPAWINNKSYFKSLPYAHVIQEFERQFNVSIDFQNVDAEQLFSGSFVHNDRTLALKSITLPLNLKYSIINDNTIVLERE
jgi:ferric-dicitrate binding protein FerR (iron transport regulator)